MTELATAIDEAPAPPSDRPGRLLELSVRDLALIERLRLELEPGLNVLTGETGAGKSLLIDALGLALGARADTTLVRHGADAARVEALFDRLPEPLIATRDVATSGRSSARLDDEAVTASRLAEIVGPLVEIHGQHEQSRLLDERWQRELLDAFGDHAELRAEMARAVGRWRENRAALDGLAIEPREVERRLELLRHEVEEIGGARLRAGEAEELRSRLELARHGEAIARGAAAIRAALDGDGSGARDALAGRRPRGALRGALRPAVRGRRDPPGRSRGGARGRRRARSAASPTALDHDAAALLGAEERLSQIYSLERRYGERRGGGHRPRRAGRGRDRAAGGPRRRAPPRATRTTRGCSLEVAEAAAVAVAATPGGGRTPRVAADEALRSLGFRAGAFAVEVGRRPAGRRRGGGRARRRRRRVRCDRAPTRSSSGSPRTPASRARPLAKIASGGELSRVALAIKQVLATADDTPTLVFDEVDAGIGGRTADPVGRSLWALARSHQVLVVTHLPQIAAHADAHFRIAKRERDGRTVTEVERLDREGRIVELAAMLGGGAAQPSTEPGEPARPARASSRSAPDPTAMATTIDLETAEPADLAPDPGASRGSGGSAVLASARELLDAAEAWRGRPVVPA